MVFVTGGTGFLGAYIIQHLVENGYRVRAFRRSATMPFFIPGNILSRVEWVDGDVLDIISLADAMKGVNAVIHSAAIVSFHHTDRKKMYQVNIDGTANVVNAALDAGGIRLIHISSVAALGRTTMAETVNEEKKWQESSNNTHYAITKHESEMHVWRAFAEGLDGVIINPSTILGFGDWNKSSCAIFKNGYREFAWYTRGINGFVGVEDVAAAVVQLLESEISHQRFIVSAENISFRDLFNHIADNFHKRQPYREATPAMGALAWRMEKLKFILTGIKPLLTKETAKVAHSKTSFDNSSLLSALPGFRYTPLASVIRNSCEKYLHALETGAIK